MVVHQRRSAADAAGSGSGRQPRDGGRAAGGVPRTDALLADPRLAAARSRLGGRLVKEAIRQAQDRVRTGAIAPDEAASAALAAMPPTAGGLRSVLNASGVLLHTNLGRAALSPAAREAVLAASGPADVEFDLATGRRARRGRTALAALLAAVAPAEAAHVVNNGAAALLLAAAALGRDREVVVSRGELVEIGDGFRLPDLLCAGGARLREVGTTNRTSLDDYAAALGPQTAFVLKVHPSNFRITGFTRSVGLRELAALGVPVVGDIGSGLLAPEPALPGEPDTTSWLRAGASLVIGSGDKLLGGPQCGLVLGRARLVQLMARHPMARALRVDKLTLAALHATVSGPATPTREALRADAEELTERARRLAERLREHGVPADARPSEAVVGAGGASGVRLPSAAVCLPAHFAARLRLGSPPVLGRIENDRCLLDLRALPARHDETLVAAVLAAAAPESRPACG